MSSATSKPPVVDQVPTRPPKHLGANMTPAQRLRWLEETMETMGRWQGAARRVSRDKGLPQG